VTSAPTEQHFTLQLHEQQLQYLNLSVGSNAAIPSLSWSTLYLPCTVVVVSLIPCFLSQGAPVLSGTWSGALSSHPAAYPFVSECFLKQTQTHIIKHFTWTSQLHSVKHSFIHSFIH